LVKRHTETWTRMVMTSSSMTMNFSLQRGLVIKISRSSWKPWLCVIPSSLISKLESSFLTLPMKLPSSSLLKNRVLSSVVRTTEKMSYCMITSPSTKPRRFSKWLTQSNSPPQGNALALSSRTLWVKKTSTFSTAREQIASSKRSYLRIATTLSKLRRMIKSIQIWASELFISLKER
jgi:hypothetical protein